MLVRENAWSGSVTIITSNQNANFLRFGHSLPSIRCVLDLGCRIRVQGGEVQVKLVNQLLPVTLASYFVWCYR